MHLPLLLWMILPLLRVLLLPLMSSLIRCPTLLHNGGLVRPNTEHLIVLYKTSPSRIRIRAVAALKAQRRRPTEEMSFSVSGQKKMSSSVVSSASEDNSTVGRCGVQDNGTRNMATTPFLITCAKM